MKTLLIDVKILISKQALERAKRNRFVKQNKRWYNKQIFMIREANLNRPAETIGDFRILPRGKEKRRIAWHFEIKNNILKIYIDDLIYHEGNRYVDNWNIRARTRNITLNDYGPYIPFTEL